MAPAVLRRVGVAAGTTAGENDFTYGLLYAREQRTVEARRAEVRALPRRLRRKRQTPHPQRYNIFRRRATGSQWRRQRTWSSVFGAAAVRTAAAPALGDSNHMPSRTARGEYSDADGGCPRHAQR